MSEFEPYVWGDEYENWWADAHLAHAEMLTRAKAFEEECGTLSDCQELANATLETTVCRHVYFREDPDEEECSIPCEKYEPGAQPYTQLYVGTP